MVGSKVCLSRQKMPVLGRGRTWRAAMQCPLYPRRLITDIVAPLTFRTLCGGLDDGGEPRLQQLQARSEAKRVERLEQIVAALLEMRPSLVMNWNDNGIGKSLRCFDGIVGVHGETKGSARLRRARKQ